jgi:Tfp pilus assembly protein PilP
MLPLSLKKMRWGGMVLSFCLSTMMPFHVFAVQDDNQPSVAAPQPESAPAEEQSAAPAAGLENVQPPAAGSVAVSEAPDEQNIAATTKRQKVLAALLKKDFNYSPENMFDPFVPFIVSQTAPAGPPQQEEEAEAPKPQMPLTPLQKMAVGQIERGFKAVLWGEMGMRALIEDDAGKGYIVGVGTPLGGNNGMVTDIQNDRLIIQQDIWDPSVKQMVPHNIEIRLTKAGEKR